MTKRHDVFRILAGAVSAVLGVGLLAVGTADAVAGPGAAQDAPGSTATIHIDPSYQHPEFEGWGASLVWMANATGGYPDEIRGKLADLLFGPDGLNLNIARYNIGGGNAPTVRKDYMKRGATMPGFWKAPQPYGPNDKQWWDQNNPDHWDFDADANQRWWIDKIKDKVDRWEAFSNSPPWFQTVSGYVSGGFDANVDQIRPDKVDEFAEYLVRVSEHIESAHGIRFDSIDPLNEPNTNYWGTTLGADGQPTGGRQEGAHAGPELQQKVLLALSKRLRTAKTKAVVSGMDETNPGIFARNWNAFTPEARAAVTQLNMHTYGTGQRTTVRDIAKGERKRLWMSEVEGTYVVGGTDYTGMKPGLGIANHIINDIRELEPSAWVLWQPIEDPAPQQAAGKNWGSIHVPFTCTAADTLATCPVQTNTKFDTMRNFTHYIRPGDRMVKVDDTSSLAAVKKASRGAVAVHVNSTTTTRAVTVDLSGFSNVSANATVTPVVTSAAGKLVQGRPVRVADRRATLTVPGESVTTFLIQGVSSVNDDVALVQSGHTYRLQGVQSGRSLAPSVDGASSVIRTNDVTRTDQLWSVRQVRYGVSNRDRHMIVNAATGKRLAVRDGATVLENATAPDEAAQWYMSTTGDGTYTFVNVAAKTLLEVPGQATADGSRVATYLATSNANQRWAVLDETAVSTEKVAAYTVPGRAPELPATVTALLRSGERRIVPVTWELPSAQRWSRPTKFSVPGTATDLLGRQVHAVADVAVDVFTSTRPGHAETYVGGRPELPATVIGVGEHGRQVNLPVTWDAAPADAFASTGVVPLTGVATIVDGSTLPATVRVQVSPPVEVNAALGAGVSVMATYAENNYPADRLRNGVTAEKGWSNWRPGAKNPSDTITFTLPKALDVTRVVTHFYRDSAAGAGLAQSLKVQVRDAGGRCVDASGDVRVGTAGAPVIDVPITSAPTTGVCVVLTAVPNGYLALGEIQVFAKALGPPRTNP